MNHRDVIRCKYFLLISYHYGGLIPRRSPEQELLERVDLYTGERAEIGGNFKVLMQKLKTLQLTLYTLWVQYLLVTKVTT